MKTLIFRFDGTCNNPEDVSDFFDDESISNIIKPHILFGRKLSLHKGKVELTSAQYSFYYSGISIDNRGNWLLRNINAVFALTYGEMDDILSEAHADLSKHYTVGDQVYIFSFSRGAAIALMLAAHFTMPIKFLGVFDTVAATRGSLDLDTENFPASIVIFENDILALYIPTLDEKWLWFQPKLFNQDTQVTEVWFAGNHSDISRGYWSDGLSDTSLQLMLDNITQAEPGSVA